MMKKGGNRNAPANMGAHGGNRRMGSLNLDRTPRVQRGGFDDSGIRNQVNRLASSLTGMSPDQMQTAAQTAMASMPRNQQMPTGMKKGGKVKAKSTSSYKSGGSVKASSASKRGDGCAIKGKTKGRMV